MAGPAQIREQLRIVLGQLDGLAVVARPAETPPAVLPALVIGEPAATFAARAERRGLDSWEFGLLVLVTGGDYQLATTNLDTLLTKTGPCSIRAVLDQDPHLGLLDGTCAYLDRMDSYGPRESPDGRQLVGAVLHLIVRTPG